MRAACPFLAADPQPARQVLAAARTAGIPRTTLFRTKHHLAIRSLHWGNEWIWSGGTDWHSSNDGSVAVLTNYRSRDTSFAMNDEVPVRTRTEVEREAETLLRDHGITGPPVDPVEIAAKLGINIFHAVFREDSISGMLARRGDNITMLINQNDGAYRKRFTIAHELGHYLLHGPVDKSAATDAEHVTRDSDLFRDIPPNNAGQTTRAEVQANWFAAALLMPAQFVQAAWEETKDMQSIARQFRVSDEAMGIRLRTLGLLQ